MQVPISVVPKIMERTWISLKNRSRAATALEVAIARLMAKSQRMWKLRHSRKNMTRIRSTETMEISVISLWAPLALS